MTWTYDELDLDELGEQADAVDVLEKLVQHTLLHGVDAQSVEWAQTLSKYFGNVEPQEPITDEDYHRRAVEIYGRNGLEIDDDPVVVRTDNGDSGAHVQAWVWVGDHEVTG